MGLSCIGLTWFPSVLGTAFLLSLGLGWNVSFVARRRSSPTVPRRPSAAASSASTTCSLARGRHAGALGGIALDTLGVTALAVGATVIVLD